MRTAVSAALGAAVVAWTAWAQPCTSITLAPASASVPGDRGTSGNITVTANPPGCARTATATESWITITAGASGTGSGVVSWSVPANPTLAERTGVINIGSAAFTITQAAGICSFSLSSSAANFSASGGTGSFQVAVQPGCSWNAVSTAAWVTITSGASGTGVGAVVYAVAANPAGTPRNASITVGTQTFGITQAAASCLSLSATSASLASTGGSSTIGIIATADCAWTAVSNADWISITSGSAGTGSGVVTFMAAANPQPFSRTGTISIGTLTFTVTQAAPCSLSFTPSTASFPASGGTGTITVAASGSTCDRSASSDASWLTITSGASGTGSGTIAYTVAANNTSQPRSATVTIGGQSYTVTQAATTCSIILTPAVRTLPSSGGSGSFTVTTSCAWTATSNSPDWLQVTSGASGTGNGAVGYSAGSNPSAASRVGSILVGDQAFNVTQLGVSCAVAITPAQAAIPAEGGAGLIDVSAAGGCAWTAASVASWISILPPAGGDGDGVARFSVAANTTGQPRTGTITIGNQVFTVTQHGAACAFGLSSNAISIPAAGGTGSVRVSTTCSWTASASVSWITIATPAGGTGEGTVSFAVTANPGVASRTGTITIGDQVFTITQAGAPCTVSLTPSEASAPGVAGTGSFRVSTATGCSWTPLSRADWIRIVSWSSVSGSGLVNYSYTTNPDPSPRSGVIDVGGQAFKLTQGPAEVRILAVVNAASAARGPVAPGLIVVIAGLGMGPDAGVAAAGRSIPTELAGTRALFDEAPAPVLYASESQVNAIAPYALEGRKSARLVVEYRGVRSAPLELEVAPAAPGIFTLDSSGSGQGAILNQIQQDYSLNGPSNAAARNSIVILYATGEGQTRPPGVDGRLAGESPPRPVLPVTVEIGGVAAPEVLYAGGAPDMAAGVMQVNVRVPARAPTGNAVPVLLRVGTYQSQPGVTMAIR